MRLLRPFVLSLFFILFSVNAFSQLNIGSYLTDARSDLGNNKYFDAIQKLDVCIKIRPDLYEAYFFRGVCKYFLNDNIGALQDLNVAVSMYDPYLSDAFHYRSYVKYELGDYDGAIKDINQVINQQSNNGRLYVERAFSKLSGQDYNGAISDCNKSLHMQYTSENQFLCKGMAFNALSKYDSALSNYNQALKLNPKNVDVYVRIGMTDAEMANYTEAIEQFNTAIKLDSAYTLAYYSRAEAYLKIEKLKKALEDFNTVIKYDPTNALAYFNRGVLEYEKDDYTDALADFNKVLLLNPKNIQALGDRAKLKATLKDYKGAISDYDRVLELFPYYIEAYYDRARIKEEMHDMAGAQADYNLGKVMANVSHYEDNNQRLNDSAKLTHLLALNSNFGTDQKQADTAAIDLLPVYYIVQNNLGSGNLPLILKNNRSEYNGLWLTNKKSKELNGAGDSTLALLNDQTTDTATQLAVLLHKAIEKTNMKIFNNAKKDYKRIVQLFPDCSLAYFAMGVDLCEEMDMLSRFNEGEQYTKVGNNYKVVNNTKNEKYQSALSDFNKAIQMEPGFAVAYYNRAFVKYKLQDFNGAVDDYNMAIQLSPDMPDVYYNRGLLLFFLSEKVAACQDFSKAGELGVTGAYALIKLYCSQVLK